MPTPRLSARFLAWALPVALVGGLTVVAVKVSSPPRPDALDRLLPSQPGTTWFYRVRIAGSDSGTLAEQVVGTGLMGPDGPASLFDIRFSDLFGQPYEELDYDARRGNRLVTFGFRNAGSFHSLTPPQVMWTAPITVGPQPTWTGTEGATHESLVHRIVSIGPATVLGHRLAGCIHSTLIVTFERANGTSKVPQDDLVCPGVGLVTYSATIGGKLLQETLVGVRSPGLSLGTVPAAAASPIAVGAPGSGPGVDPGRSNDLPRGTFDPHRLAWTQDREQTTPEIRFPPVGAQGRSILAEGDGSVTATDTGTGQVLWRLRLQGPIVASPVLAGGVVLVADAGKHLWALDAETGLARWVTSFPDLVATAPVVGDGVVVVAGEDRVVHGLRLEDGRELWRQGFSELIQSPPAISGHDVVIADAAGDLNARTLRTGQEVWSRRLDGALTGGPAVAGGLVVAESDTGTVFAYDARTGDERWNAAPGSNLEESPALAAGLVIVIEDNTDHVTAFDATDGHRVWRTSYPGDPVGAPLVVGSDVLVLSGDATVHRFDLRTGTRRADVVPTPPGPGQTYQTSLPLTAFGGSVVLEAKTEAQWPETHLLAFSAGSPAGADGIRFTGEVRVLPSNPKTPPTLVGNDIVYAGTDGAVWSVPPAGVPHAVFRSAALGAFVVPDGPNLLVQDGTHLEAVARSGGAPVWRTDMPAASAASVPAVSGGTVFVPLAKLGIEAVESSTGRQVWPPQPVTDVGASSAPLALPGGDVAYAPGELVRLDGRTGAVRWRLPGIAVFAPMAYDAGRIFAEDLTSGLTAVDATTGKIAWSSPLNIAPLVGPAAGEGVVVAVDANGKVHAFDQATGTVRWTTQLRTAPSGTPAIVGDRVVIAQKGRTEDNYERDRELEVFDLATGRFEGSFETAGINVGFGGVSFGAAGDRLILPATTTSPSAAFLLRLAGTP